ncbi:MAG: hypothetical protein ACLQVA_14675 [Candidatus Brocadiia bacterium]
MHHSAARRLIWVPVVHTEADLGNMSESVKSLYVQKMGRAKWEQHIVAIRTFWSKLEEQVTALRLPYERVRLYQDGLPCCGREAEIVRTLALAGSLNCRLLLKLMDRGAQITGTESPELLLEEYDLARSSLIAETSAEPAWRADLRGRILDLRDRYIAARIDRTLQQGETGLIFLGMLHSLDRRLPAGIRVTQLRVKMPARRPTGRE